MFKNNEIFYPNKTYFRLDFEAIKSGLMRLSKESQDYGSVFILKEKDCWISVNELGKIEFFYDEIPENQQDSIANIENVFRGFVEDFRILH